MKKTLLLYTAAVMFLFSCKKEHSATISPVKKYKVTFNVANFTQSQKAFALRHNAIGLASSDTLTALNTYVDVLYYMVLYNSAQGFDRRPIKQDSTMSNMGMITDSLPAGTYQIAFLAGKKGLLYSGYRDLDYFGYNGPDNTTGVFDEQKWTPWQDTFWNGFTLTVGSGNITQNVTLNRVVGKLELRLLDNIPAAADSLSITLQNEASSKWLNSGDSHSSPIWVRTYSIAIPASAKGQPNFTVDKIVGDTDIGGTIIITCKDAAGHTIATSTVNNVRCYKNEKTILSGKLFSGAPQQSFTAKIDTNWSNNPTTYNW